MKKIFQIIIACCVLSSIIIAQPDLEAVIPKNIYYTGEPVEIGINTILLGNFIIPDKYQYKIEIKLINEKGEKLPYTGPSGNNFSPDMKELKENKETYRIKELNLFFGTNYPSINMDKFIKPGRYTAEVSLYNPESLIKTINVSFEIKNPEENELIVYNSFFRAFKDLEMSKSPDRFYDFVNTLRLILDKNPATVYAPNILTYLAMVYGNDLKLNDKKDDIRKEMAVKYTWSGRGQGMIENLLKKMPSKFSRIDYLKRLQELSKNSVMEKFFENKLYQESKK